MQYNLDFIKKGQKYPPDSEAERLQNYTDYIKLYNGQTQDVFRYYLTRLVNAGIYNDTEEAAFLTSLNYFRLLTKKTADLVCGEKPDVKTPEGTADNITANVKTCVDIVNRKLRKAMIDFSRLGESVLRPYKKDDDANIAIMSPYAWVPVVSEEDNDEITNYVIAYPETLPNDRLILKIQVHYKGYFEERTHYTKIEKQSINLRDKRVINFNAYVIGDPVKEPVRVETGADSFAIIHIANEPTSDNIHGTSDYDDIVTIVAELEIRFAQIARILDKHASPSMAAALNNFTFTHSNGQVTSQKLIPGSAYVIGDNGEIPQYITWDAQLTAAYTQIEQLRKELDRLTELGAVIADNDQTGGSTQGFEALQVRMTNARLKARRITEEIDQPYKDLISMLYQLKYNTALPVEINVTWNDGLPNDAKRDAEIANMQMQNGAKTRKTIRKEFYGMDEKAAEYEEVQYEKEMVQQFPLGFTGQNGADLNGDSDQTE